MRKLGSLLLKSIRRPILLICLIQSGFRLLLALPILRKAKVIVVMEEGGFGHTIAGPEAARRLFKNQRPVFILLSDRNFHNAKVRLLWQDIHVLFLRLVWHVQFGNQEILMGGPSLDFRKKIHAVLVQWLKRFTKAEVISLQELYDHVAFLHPVPALSKNKEMNSVRWVPGWARLLETIPAEKVRLPSAHRRIIQERIDRFQSPTASAENGTRPLCCLYLRARGVHVNLESFRRNGSPAESYLPAIGFLIEKGYTVLVTGDRLTNPSYAQEFDRRVICAKFIGIDPRLFDLFAATEANLWIGDTGGGTWLSIINRIPMLVLNAFPIGFGAPYAWMCYKTILDKAGQLIPPMKLFSEHCYDFEMDGLTVHDNSSQEILSATAAFLQSLSLGSNPDEYLHFFQNLPEEVLAKHVHCRLSPAWGNLSQERNGWQPTGGLHHEPQRIG